MDNFCLALYCSFGMEKRNKKVISKKIVIYRDSNYVILVRWSSFLGFNVKNNQKHTKAKVAYTVAESIAMLALFSEIEIIRESKVFNTNNRLR